MTWNTNYPETETWVEWIKCSFFSTFFSFFLSAIIFLRFVFHFTFCAYIIHIARWLTPEHLYFTKWHSSYRFKKLTNDEKGFFILRSRSSMIRNRIRVYIPHHCRSRLRRRILFSIVHSCGWLLILSIVCVYERKRACNPCIVLSLSRPFSLAASFTYSRWNSLTI